MIFRAIKINKTKPGGTGMASECHKGEALKFRVKLHIVGTVNRLNVEHRTSNIERPILRRYALSILRQANRRISNVEGWNRFAQSFLKLNVLEI